MEETTNQQAIIYLVILIVLEVLIFVFIAVSKENNMVMYSIIRLILLVGAHCLKSLTWAAYYCIFALIAALFVVDPVGLWFTGHDQSRTNVQHAFIMILMLALVTAVIVGYCYKKALEKQNDQDFIGDANQVSSAPPPSGNNYMYQQGPSQNRNSEVRQSKGFKQFSGQGYSLD